MIRPDPRHLAFTIIVAAAIAAGCSHANYNPPTGMSGPTSAPGIPTDTNTGSSTIPTDPGTTSQPLPCGSQAPGTVKITMATYTQGATSPYGNVDGYNVETAGGGTSSFAAPIVVRPNDSVQFVNAEGVPTSGSADTYTRDAVGFQGTGFPATPYTFPTSTAQAVGTAISATAPWSTGPIPDNTDPTQNLCASQTFSVPASGTFYFGDYYEYNAGGLRDVIVVSANAAMREPFRGIVRARPKSLSGS